MLITQLAVELLRIVTAGVLYLFDIASDASDHRSCSGPGFRTSDFESNRIIGDAQFQGARTLMSQTLQPVTGAVKSVHAYLNMAFHNFTLPDGTHVQTCPPAMGKISIFLVFEHHW